MSKFFLYFYILVLTVIPAYGNERLEEPKQIDELIYSYKLTEVCPNHGFLSARIDITSISNEILSLEQSSVLEIQLLGTPYRTGAYSYEDYTINGYPLSLKRTIFRFDQIWEKHRLCCSANRLLNFDLKTLIKDMLKQTIIETVDSGI